MIWWLRRAADAPVDDSAWVSRAACRASGTPGGGPWASGAELPVCSERLAGGTRGPHDPLSMPSESGSSELSVASPAVATAVLLARWAEGDAAAGSRVFERMYEELRSIARNVVWDPHQTLNPTALVNEVYTKLLAVDARSFSDRRHFLAVAATSMRHVMTDAARQAKAAKRGGGRTVPLLADSADRALPSVGELLVVSELVEKLARVDDRSARLVDMRVFGGMELGDIAAVLGVSRATVCRDWAFARAWLALEIEGRAR